MGSDTTIPMPVNFEAYSLPEFTRQPVSRQLVSMLGVIRQADESALFNQAGDIHLKRSRLYLSKSQIATLHTYLGLLGYLDRKIPPAWEKTGMIQIDRRMRNAIRSFKDEAGLALHENDDWVDQETWNTLEELVSFEVPFRAERWLGKATGQRQALWRAAGARLAVLGFMNAPTYDRKKIARAMIAFDELILMLAPKRFPAARGKHIPDIELQRLERLFDQPALVKCLASFEKEFIIQPVKSLTQAQAEQQVNKFAACMANIELWLLGYPVELEKNYLLESGAFSRESSSTVALRNFWSDSGLTAAEFAIKMADGITGEFFRVVLGVLKKSRKLEIDQRQSERLYRQLVKETRQSGQPFIEQVWGRFRELGSRMWDGIQRAWAWIVKQIKGTGVDLSGEAANFARLVFHFAVKSFQKVKQTVDGFIRSLKYLGPGSVDRTRYLYTRKPFHYLLVIPDQPGEIAQQSTLGNEMLSAADDFGHGMSLLISILEIIKQIVLLIALPFAGWLAFAISLVKVIGEVFMLPAQ